MTTKRINLWSSPRNISTAIMYSFAERPDTHVLDEPLYGHYLRNQPTSAQHPAANLVMKAQPEDADQVIDQLLHRDFKAPVLVVKQMTHHLHALDEGFLEAMDNVLLIRDPRRILASYNQQVEDVTAADIGYPKQLELAQRKGVITAVIDTKRLLQNPHNQLERLCEKLALPFTTDMLSWAAGPKPYDGSWAPHWYTRVHQSTGFAPYTEKKVELSPKLELIAKAVEGMYEELKSMAL